MISKCTNIEAGPGDDEGRRMLVPGSGLMFYDDDDGGNISQRWLALLLVGSADRDIFDSGCEMHRGVVVDSATESGCCLN